MTEIINVAEYREDIIVLWQESFGDEREYIEFFLNECPDKICIGATENGRAVSVLFLLNGSVCGLSCKYVYAACTMKKYRGRGLMGELISFAKNYCRDCGIDLIFLVPGEESLYSFYERFGFVTKMMCREFGLDAGGNGVPTGRCTDVSEISRRRAALLSLLDSFTFDVGTTEYVVREFMRGGGEIYSVEGENGFLAFLYKKEENLIFKEILTEKIGFFTDYSNLFKKLNAENVYIHTPLVYNSKDIGVEATKCGMLFPVSARAEIFISSKEFFYAGMYLD